VILVIACAEQHLQIDDGAGRGFSRFVMGASRARTASISILARTLLSIR
jgi:hypothetical protein